MAAIDRNAAALGVPQRQLMESSGNAVAGVVRELASPGDRIAILAGRGNNGGDAFAAARFLDDFDLSIQLLGRADTITTEIARANWEALRAGEYPTSEIRDSAGLHVPDADIIVDALLGTGVRGAAREPATTAIELINTADAPVLSVDVPSGLDPDTGAAEGVAVAADRVVTFHDRTPGLAKLDVPVTVADIGIPAAAETFVGPGDLQALDRPATSHKGDAGRVLVIGGGPYTGAPALAGQATLRAGADLVEVACPAPIADVIQGYTPDLIVTPLDGDRLVPELTDRLLDRAALADVVVIGPGLGNAEPTQRAVREFLRAADGRIVVDADALRVVPEIESHAELVCTPHQGELEAMGGPREADWDRRRDTVANYAGELGHTLLVKGHYDVVSDGERSRVSRTGNPGMTVGGTGDVLAGVVAAMLAQKDDPVTGAAIAAYVNGRAGDAAAESRGDSLLASDLLDHLPSVIMEARE